MTICIDWWRSFFFAGRTVLAQDHHVGSMNNSIDAATGDAE
jgi:hypothetical protein